MQQAKGQEINKIKSVNSKQAMDKALTQIGKRTNDQSNRHRHRVNKPSQNNTESTEYLKGL